MASKIKETVPYQDFFTTSLDPSLIPEKTNVPIVNTNNNTIKSLSLPTSIESSNEILCLTKDMALNLTIEENSLRSRFKDVEFRLSHEITLINQLYYNIEYLSSFFTRNSQNLEEDNRICENLIGYLDQEIKEMKKMVEISEKKIEKFEEKRKKSMKKS